MLGILNLRGPVRYEAIQVHRKPKLTKAPVPSSSPPLNESSTAAEHTVPNMSNRNPFQDYVNRMQQVARSGGGGGGPFPRGGPPKNILYGIGSMVVLGGGALVFQNTLFNVDGGHRAIKYKRLSGVSKEIYGEGMSDPSGQTTSRSTTRY
jgi:hypothetical protein